MLKFYSMVFFLILLSFASFSQTILINENFESAVFPPSGWRNTPDASANTWALLTDNASAVSGSNSAKITKSYYSTANTWLFTRPFTGTAGTIYRISYWYKSITYPDADFKVTIGNSDGPGAQINTLHSYVDLKSSAYMEGVDYFQAPVTGPYYVGFNCFTPSYKDGTINIDSVVITSLPPCTGIPVAGTVTASSSVICFGDTSNLNIIGNYIGSQLHLQWQSSPAGTANFTNIIGEQSATLKTVQQVNTAYRCTVSCVASGQTSISNAVTVTINPGCYCTPTASADFCASYAYISRVRFAGIDNSSNCGNAYNFYSAASTTGKAYNSATMPLIITSPNTTLFKYTGVWIDYNLNGKFEPTEFIDMGSTANYSSVGELRKDIVIPAGALAGTSRMRVRVSANLPLEATDACTPVNGETEDYPIQLSALTACTAAPVPGNIVSSDDSICGAVNFTLSVTGSSVSGLYAAYQWQQSTNGTVWTDIAGELWATLTISQNTNMYYRRKITCNNSLSAYTPNFLQKTKYYLNCICKPPNFTCVNPLITNVTLGSMVNNSSCGTYGYANYGSTLAPQVITAGTANSISVTVVTSGINYGTAYAKFWIDFNHNGSFENTEMFYLGSTRGTSIFTVHFNVPFNAVAGLTTLRVVALTDSSSSACATYVYGGNIHDYLLNVIPSSTPQAHFSVYVNQSGVAGTGTTWANAFTSLQDALYVAMPFDTIKVAKGTYSPGGTSSASFILKNNVIVLGGFPGTGNPANSARNWAVNQTILTGELGDLSQFADNCYSVVVANGLDGASTLDGFIIEKANGNSEPYSAFYGGAVTIKNSPGFTLANCVLRNNYSYTGGSAIYCYASSPVIKNCFIMNNEDGNYAPLWFETRSRAKMFSCVLAGNKSGTVCYTNNSQLLFTNNTVVNNMLKNFTLSSRAVRTGTFITEKRSNLAVNNSIFFNNTINDPYYTPGTSTTDSLDIISDSSTVSVSYSITQVYKNGLSLLPGDNPHFRDTSSIAGPDNFYFTSDDGLQINNPCSPAMNAGLNDAATGIATDLLNNQRLANGTVDIGAYEIQTAPASVPAIVYVKGNATGNNDGSSWANAFTDLQNALYSCSGIIKVAAGTYYPSGSNPASSFVLQRNRLLLGGYPSTGNPGDAQRNPAANPTILSGNLPNGSKSLTIIKASVVDSTAILDGFSVTGGVTNGIFISAKAYPVIKNIAVQNNGTGILAKDSSHAYVKNCLIRNNAATGLINNFSYTRVDSCSFLGNNGAAIGNKNSSPVVSNTNFRNNFNENLANYDLLNGGDVVNDNSAARFTNCNFFDSLSAASGGALFNTNESKPVFTNCDFRNGKAMYKGGVCLNENSAPEFYGCSFMNSTATTGGVIYNISYSRPIFVNCIASANSATSATFMYSEKSAPSVINCTIVNNLTNYAGSNSTYCVFFNTDSSALVIRNSILWNNSISVANGPAGFDIIEQSITPTVVTNSFLQNSVVNGTNGNSAGINPRLKDITNPAGPDNKLFTADDGLALCSCSPAINKGSNGALTGISVDIINNTRINGGSVDIGAYETSLINPATQKSFYVSAGATGANNGTSWANAYKDLRVAVQNACADTLRVAAGTYKLALNARDSFVNVNRGIVLLAGYPASGNIPDSSRNADLYPAVLDGDIGVQGDSTDNTYSLMKINCWDTTALIDGLTFKRANIYGGPNSNYGAVMALGNKNLTLRNCRFMNNTGTLGSGLYSYGQISVENCVFVQNNSDRGAYSSDGPGAAVRNSVFYNNKAFLGGGVFAGTDAVFENVIFYGNDAYDGGGVYLNENPAARFTNCSFIRNNCSGDDYGAGLLNHSNYSVPSSKPAISNCVFAENRIFNNVANTQNSDWANNSNGGGVLNIKNSATLTYVPYDNTCISPGTLVFKDIDNPAGADGRWFTADDGLQMEPCSGAINTGSNLAAQNIVTDITSRQRIKNEVVDMGPYEYQSTKLDNILFTADDSLVANREIPDTSGWTNYFEECKLLMSVKKGSQYNFGYVGATGFKVLVKTTPGYGSGAGYDLSAAQYVSKGLSWRTMNRFWKITPSQQITDSVIIRLPFSNTDFTDLKGGQPSLHQVKDMVFYTVDSPYSPLDKDIPAAQFHEYLNGAAATTSTWKYIVSDSINYAEFAVKKLNGGSAGFGTGFNNGAIGIASSNVCIGAGRSFIADITGSSYQWQVNSGAGYTNIVNNTNYTGANTATLTINSNPLSWQGYLYRCLVNGDTYTAYYALKYQNTWTGAVNNSWENPGNWSCGTIPEAHTDVLINTGTVLVNSNAIVSSLTLQPGVHFTVSTGYSFIVLR